MLQCCTHHAIVISIIARFTHSRFERYLAANQLESPLSRVRIARVNRAYEVEQRLNIKVNNNYMMISVLF